MSQLPFQLLELNIISAQDLAPVSKNLKVYAMIWVNPERKLRTRIDEKGHNNPTWNDKFVFRVDDAFLDSDTSAVMIEIFATGWLRNILIGSVRVLINNLIPPDARKENNMNRRFIALQVRRPSSRPQGILNMGVSLLDNTMRSMPIYAELCGSALGFQDILDEKSGNGNKEVQLWRCQSDGTELSKKNLQKKGKQGGSMVNGSLVNGSMVNGSIIKSSIVNGPCEGNMGNGSMVNGSEVGVPGGAGSACNSDIGPSPSVVAAAVARGLYPTQMVAPRNPGSSILEAWTVGDLSTEGLRSKIERWKMELPPLYDNQLQINQKLNKKGKKHLRRHTDGGNGLFTCFAGCCQITVTCGDNKKNRSRGYNGSQVGISDLDI